MAYAQHTGVLSSTEAKPKPKQRRAPLRLGPQVGGTAAGREWLATELSR